MSMFHPAELAICGYSGSGKTTLIRRLLERFTPTYRVGYAKHSSHAFQMDHDGKDTAIARAAGAARAFIAGEFECAMTAAGDPDFIQRRTLFDNCEFVLVEGWKSSPLPRLMMLDADAAITRDLAPPKAGPILAWVGASSSRPAELPGDALYLQRDNIEELGALVLRHMMAPLARTPIHGLVLAGGRSTRMGRDKATLNYHGQSQLAHAVSLVKPFCPHVWVSCRADQAMEPHLAPFPQIHDSVLDCGPTGGILSAMRAHPDAAWLVLACDLPYLAAPILQHLLAERRPLRVATAFRSAHDGLPEPLCALYEPRARARLFQFIAQGYECPRKMLINSLVHLLDLPEPRALDNINHPDEFEAARRDLGRPAEPA